MMISSDAGRNCIRWVALLVVLFPILAVASEVSNGAKYSTIQEVDGYAFLSEDMTLSQTRQAAFANAKRQAVEAARTYIRSKTKVKDFEVRYDVVWSDAEGAVEILEQKDNGIVENSRYHVWIRAEVSYDMNRKPGKESDVVPSEMPLTVTVWSSRKTYREGESIVLFMKGNRDFYARVVNVNEQGDIIQLVPNQYRTDNHFKAEGVYQIPDDRDRFDLVVAPPFGRDTIKVYASEVPLQDVPTEAVGNGLGVYRGDLKSLSFKARGIRIEKMTDKPFAGAQFHESTYSFTTTAD